MSKPSDEQREFACQLLDFCAELTWVSDDDIGDAQSSPRRAVRRKYGDAVQLIAARDAVLIASATADMAEAVRRVVEELGIIGRSLASNYDALRVAKVARRLTALLPAQPDVSRDQGEGDECGKVE